MIPLYPLVAADYDSIPSSTAEIVEGMEGWLAFNMTEDFRKFFNNTLAYSATWMVKKVYEKDFGSIAFWSCEVDYCPEFVVYTVTNCYLEPL